MTVFPIAGLWLTLSACNSTPSIPDLKPASELNQACYDWPAKEFAPGNTPKPKTVYVSQGDPAVDFTLKDVNGKDVNLATLLDDKPVLLVSGSYTCNVFQSRLAEIKKVGKQYKDDIHTVIVYNIEAHPKGDPSPYKGKPWPVKDYSDRGQADSYEKRVEHAKDIDPGPNVKLVVDALEEGNANPYWCTYGSCPNCAFLVNQEGRLETVHEWFDGRTMRGSIEAMLKRDKQG